MFFIKRYLVLLPILALGAYIIIANRGCTATQLFGAGLVGFYWQQLAFLGHDGGHRSHTNNRGEEDEGSSYGRSTRTYENTSIFETTGSVCCIFFWLRLLFN